MGKQTIYNVLWPIIHRKQWKEIVEVGVNKGTTAKLICAHCNLNNYWLVDPWKEYKGEGAGSLAEVKQWDWDNRYHDVKKLEIAYDFVEVIREKSLEASLQFDDNSVDLVFIDGNHTYAHTYSDILFWLPKIRNGGALMGHDYSHHFPGVQKAVDELLPGMEIVHSSIWKFDVIKGEL